MSHILIIEDEPVIRSALKKLLERQNYQITDVDSVEEALKLPLDDMALVISDLRLPGAPGTDIIAATSTPVLIMTSYASLRSAVDAMKQGAVDYIAKPFNHDEMVLAVERILKERQQTRRTTALKADIERAYPTTDIIAECEAMKTLMSQLNKLADSDTCLLLTGESGTGKELIVRTLHARSQRADGPLVIFSASSTAADTQEAELFGHEPNAIEGQSASRPGMAEKAQGGTLFIDQVGELTAESQARLLQLLDQGISTRIGDLDGYNVDIRLVASNQKDLEKLVKEGKFREDLYYRIKGVELLLPPLRDRGEDILLLANSLLSRSTERLNSGELYFSKEAIDAMQRYSWPGNVRELANAIERAVILAESGAITPELLGVDTNKIQRQTLETSSHEELSLKEYFTRFVLENQDSMTETALARKLGISRKSLWERRQRFGIPRK